jgi:hypothetical protein
MFLLKGAQVLDFRPLVFCTNKSYLGIWPRVWKKIFIYKFELCAILYFKLMLCVHKKNVRAVGYNKFDFYLENKEARPSDGSKLKYKTH